MKQKTPYNYCDGRCDRCELTKDCTVYKDIQTSRLKNIMRGRDPDDMEVVLEEVGDSFKKAHEIMKKACEEQGLSWEEIEEGAKTMPDMPDFRDDPTFKLGNSFCKKAHEFLEWSKENLIITPEIEEHFRELDYYHMLIPAKLARMSRMDSFDDDDLSKEAGRLTADVIYKAIRICDESLSKIAFYRSQSSSRVQTLRDRLVELKNKVSANIE